MNDEEFNLHQVRDDELADYISAISEDTNIEHLKIQLAMSGAYNIPDDFKELVDGLIAEKKSRGI